MNDRCVVTDCGSQAGQTNAAAARPAAVGVIVIVTGDRSLLVEHITGIGISVLAELVGYHVAFIDAGVDRSGLLGDMGFIGRRDWHPAAHTCWCRLVMGVVALGNDLQ